ETAEQYMRDIDAGRRTDRPTAGDGLACQQALNRLTADAGWRELYLSGDIATHKLVNTLNRIIAYAAADDKPITPQVASALSALGVRGSAMTAVEITKPKRYRSRKYSAEPVALMPDDAALGPAMLALTDRQRQFVLEYVNGPSLGYGAATRAARAAGY